MKKFTLLLSLSAALTTVSFAQTPAPQSVGVMTRVDGLITVSQGNTLGNAFKEEVILQNARVVTTANGSTSMRLNNGCIVDLKPNQAVTIDIGRECKEIQASIQSTEVVGASVASDDGVLSQRNALIMGAGVLGIFVLQNLQKLSGS